MSLELQEPRKGKTPYFYIRGTYLGVEINRSAKTDRRAIALKMLKQIEAEIERGELGRDLGPSLATRAVEYMQAGGSRKFLVKQTADGNWEYAPLLKLLGERVAEEITQDDLNKAAVALYPNATTATRNRQVFTPVSAVLKHAGIEGRFKRPKGSRGKQIVAWLWPEQAAALFREADKRNRTLGALLIFLCYTGCRLSEALKLTWSNVRLSERYALVPDTKTGVPRAVFLPKIVVASLATMARGEQARVFSICKSGHLYQLLDKVAAAAGVELPARSAFHIFRHTYASWMRRYAKVDTKGLVATGAWKDTRSAERYVHAVASEEAQQADLLPVPGLELAPTPKARRGWARRG